MEQHIKYGLVGKNIAYSFSQKFFTEKFKKLFLKNRSYEVFDIDKIEEIKNIITLPDLKGFNVTIPYKEQILPFLDELSEEAKQIGAVNTVLIKDGKTTGYNTDAYGFERTLAIHRKKFHQKAIILGDGGAAKAVKFVLSKHGIPFISVSRKGELNFENLTAEIVSEQQIVVQCTPVGTFPNCDDCLVFPFDGLTDKHLVIDLIYNPNYTEFIKKSREKGAKCLNGYYMLEQQAEKAWEIWKS